MVIDETAEAAAPGTGIALKLGIEAVKKIAPTGMAWVKTFFIGKQILVLGPSAVGKSSFCDYLRHGVLEEEGQHDKTHNVTASPMFELLMGKNDALKLSVKKVLDTPGHWGAGSHADLLIFHKPHAILILLDGARAQTESNNWIKEFGEHLDTLNRKHPKLVKKIQSIIVVINKYDKSTKSKYARYESSIKKQLVKSLKDVLGQLRAKSVPIKKCVTVENLDGTKYIDAVIRTLARELTK
jgi:GTPase SAR1 family protein